MVKARGCEYNWHLVQELAVVGIDEGQLHDIFPRGPLQVQRRPHLPAGHVEFEQLTITLHEALTRLALRIFTASKSRSAPYAAS